MAVTLEEFELKLKSEIAAAGSKDVAALQRVDAAVRSAAGSLENLQQKAKDAIAARDAAAAKLGEATAGKGGVVDVAAVKRAQAALAKAQAGADTAGARAVAGAGKLDALQAARPKLEALALEKNAIRERAEAAKVAARDEARALKEADRERARVAREAVRAGKEVDRERTRAAKEAARAAKDASKKAEQEQADRSRAAAEFKGVLAEQAIEAAKWAAAMVASAVKATVAFVIASASAARNLRILGEALTGNAKLGGEFSAVVNQLARQVPLAKDQIAELARELELMRLGRRDMQAGLTAIAIVTSALGDSAGGAIKSIVQSTAATRRFQLGARDLYGEFTALAGTGLKKADILGALAKQLGRSVPEVEAMLLRGQISVKDGLRALEAAAQARFGKTIAAQMLDVNVQFDKARESLAAMFADVNLEPLLNVLQTVLSLLNEQTYVGGRLKDLLTFAFNDIGSAIGGVAPLIKSFFEGAIIGALQMYLVLRPIARGFAMIAAAVASAVGWIAKKLGIDALEAGKFAVFALAAAFGLLGVAITIAFIPLIALGAVILVGLYAIYKFVEEAVSRFKALYDLLSGMSWSEIGENLIASLISGITGSAGKLLASVSDLGTSAIKAFKATVAIGSPSKVFRGFGRNISESAGMGVEEGAPALEGAAHGLGSSAMVGAGAGASAAGGGAAEGHGGRSAVVPIYLFPGGPFLRNLIVSIVNGEIEIATDGAGAGFDPGVA